jgi:hypothetical protein
MSEDTGDDEGKARVTVRVDQSKLDRLDDLIWENKVEGVLDRDTTRSDLLREQIDALVEELEGNSTPTPTAQTAD